MDYSVCGQCGANFPRMEDVKRDGRLVAVDWSVEANPTCPACRGLKAVPVPPRSVLGGYPPGRKSQGVKPVRKAVRK